METKEELMRGVKEWVQIDNDILKMKNDIKKLNERKKQLTDTLVRVMKENEIDCFDLKDGNISYKKNVTKKALSGKSLMTILGRYFENDGKTAEQMTKYILDNREEQTKETIKRKIEKT